MEAGSVLVDHTTASAGLARELSAAAAERGVGFVDAPVSGGQAGAENGALTVMCGGDDESVFESARAVIMAYAKACERLGPAGAGQLTKMVNQICIAGIVQGLVGGRELRPARRARRRQVVDVIGKGAAQSWQMDNRARTMARGEFEFGFAVEWMRKDLGICLDEADRNGARLPVDGAHRPVLRAGRRPRRPPLGHEQPRAPVAEPVVLLRPFLCRDVPRGTRRTLDTELEIGPSGRRAASARRRGS